MLPRPTGWVRSTSLLQEEADTDSPGALRRALCRKGQKDMVIRYEHLGPYSDLVDFAASQPPAIPGPITGPEAARAAIGFPTDGEPRDVEFGASWERDGVRGQRVSWFVGYGPRTEAYLLQPSGATKRRPGVLALHGHDGKKWFGRDKIADGPDGPLPTVEVIRREYEGRALADEVARAGFVVLAPCVFTWGSRRFPLDAMPAAVPPPGVRWKAPASDAPVADRIGWYDWCALHHEHVVAKYLTVLETTLAGVVSFEDRIAARVLRALPNVASGPLGAVGLSGGGARAGLLTATCSDIGAAVVAGMMGTYRSLLGSQIHQHTWMLFPPGLSEWADLVAARPNSPLLVQYKLDDHLFPEDGSRAAHARLTALFDRAGGNGLYRGEFYPGPHSMSVAMQDSANAFLERALR